MMQMMHLLEMKGFRNYVVTGGGIEFVRSFCERIYKIPPEQVIGTHFQYKFIDSITPSGVRLSAANYTVVVKEEKPENIALVIGKRPVIAVGNSNGDLQMLEYTDDRKGPSLQILGKTEMDGCQHEKRFQGHVPIGNILRLFIKIILPFLPMFFGFLPPGGSGLSIRQRLKFGKKTKLLHLYNYYSVYYNLIVRFFCLFPGCNFPFMRSSYDQQKN